jgi:hypothetical protein
MFTAIQKMRCERIKLLMSFGQNDKKNAVQADQSKKLSFTKVWWCDIIIMFCAAEQGLMKIIHVYGGKNGRKERTLSQCHAQKLAG